MYQGFNNYPPPPSHTYAPGEYPPPPPQSSGYPSSYPQTAVATAPPFHEPSYGTSSAMYHHGFSGNRTAPTGNSKGYYWIDWNSHQMVPATAVQGGVDKDGCPIYVGRAFHEGDWIPAKVIPNRQVAYVAFAGGEHPKNVFQLLCEQRFDWVACSGGSIPPGAVEGGRTNTGEPLFIGRAWHDGAHTVGKVHPSHNCCYIPYGGQELSFPTYEILVLRM